MRDLMSNIHPVVALAPAAISDGTARISAAIDLHGFNSCTFVIVTGDLADADATWSVTVKAGDDATQANHVAVADAELIGTEAQAGFTFANDGAARKIGYAGVKRYVSIEIDDVTANLAAANFAVVAILGHPGDAPSANPPA